VTTLRTFLGYCLGGAAWAFGMAALIVLPAPAVKDIMLRYRHVMAEAMSEAGVPSDEYRTRAIPVGTQGLPYREAPDGTVYISEPKA